MTIIRKKVTPAIIFASFFLFIAIISVYLLFDPSWNKYLLYIFMLFAVFGFVFIAAYLKDLSLIEKKEGNIIIKSPIFFLGTDLIMPIDSLNKAFVRNEIILGDSVKCLGIKFNEEIPNCYNPSIAQADNHLFVISVLDAFIGVPLKEAVEEIDKLKNI